MLEKEAEKLDESQEKLLESRFINDYLRMKGCCQDDLPLLPEEQARRLMSEASRYASMKLSEHKARAELRKEVHYD